MRSCLGKKRREFELFHCIRPFLYILLQRTNAYEKYYLRPFIFVVTTNYNKEIITWCKCKQNILHSRTKEAREREREWAAWSSNVKDSLYSLSMKLTLELKRKQTSGSLFVYLVYSRTALKEFFDSLQNTAIQKYTYFLFIVCNMHEFIFPWWYLNSACI